jgi:hypothetical protein
LDVVSKTIGRALPTHQLNMMEKKWKSIILIMPKQYQRDWPEVRRQKITRRNKNSSETKQTISLIGWRLDPFNSIPCSIFLATWSTLEIKSNS